MDDKKLRRFLKENSEQVLDKSSSEWSAIQNRISNYSRFPSFIHVGLVSGLALILLVVFLYQPNQKQISPDEAHLLAVYLLENIEVDDEWTEEEDDWYF